MADVEESRAHRHRQHRHRHQHRHDEPRSHSRSRSRSPRRRHHHHHHHHHHHSSHHRKRSPAPLDPTVNPYPRPEALPYKAAPISRHDLKSFTPIFASYLDIQKQIAIENVDEQELKGRWKSFVNKWNRGELAQGWYDPETKRKADEAARDEMLDALAEEEEAEQRVRQSMQQMQRDDDASDDDDDDGGYGPAAPALIEGAADTRRGPTAATSGDLALRDELLAEDEEGRRDDLRHERKLDRRQQKERLDELAPRAEPGTRERQLEKRREKADAARAFKDAKGEAGGMAEVGERDLMGGGGGVDDVKRMRAEQDRKKNERQIKKEEALRARAAERDERMKGLKEREDKTMEMLKAIAKERFG